MTRDAQAMEGVGIVLDVHPDAPVVVSLVPGKASSGSTDKLKVVKGLDKKQLKKALEEAGCMVHDEKFLESVFKELDADSNWSIGLEEFKCAVRRCPQLSNLCFSNELKGVHNLHCVYIENSVA